MVTKYTLCGVDQHFLQTVIDSFSGTGFSSEGLDFILWTLGIALGLFVLSHYLNRYRRARAKDSGDWISKPENILEIFQQALRERSRFEVSFASGNLRRRTTHCALIDVSNDVMVLEPPLNTAFSSKMEGREMRAFFGISSAKSPNEHIYYTSVSQLLEVERISPDLVHLKLKLPLRLSVSQKRDHLRLSPPLKYLGEVAMWPDNAECRIRFESLALNGVDELTDSIKYRIINLSAGGMSLEVVYPSRTRLISETAGVGEECFLFFNLLRPESDIQEDYFFTARVRHRLELGMTVKLGLKFLQRVYPDPLEEGKLHWEIVGPDGVSDLADWVMLRHLELFREHGYW